ncbi:MAG: DUF362 domain-containing protein [Sedimentisphaerales bacterium]|nr:DUF362 domain-containing protein [Sedimentisphaerales bacterium]
MCICMSIGCIWSSLSHTTAKFVLADPQPPNEPNGIAQGIYPGRVVWVYDANATNENCTNTYTPIEDGWFLSKNNDQAVIDRMVSQMLRSLTGEISDEAAWDALFRDFNRKKGRGDVGYFPGEKIMIKINAVSTWLGNYNSNYSIVYNEFYGISETSPQVILSVLRQLVNVYGVHQQDITVGDPMKHIYKHTYDLLHNEFLSVKYLDHSAHNWGRTQMVPSANPEIFYSDRGTILREVNLAPVYNDYLPTCITEANYMINIGGFKGHARAGITACAKNFFGANCRYEAPHLHEGLVSPDEVSQSRTGYGLYRVQVDLMGHRLLGGNTVINIVDGLWGGPEAIEGPEKWVTAPFNNDYSSSIFASQDLVALESVCFDFLKEEFTAANHPDTYWPQMDGVDDYLHQAADSNNWPAGIIYDPEDDGIPIESLGVHEHWNDANNKEYTRNLDPVNGQGIELVHPALDHYFASITKCTINTGRRRNNFGKIRIKGLIDITADDLNEANSIEVSVDSNDMLTQCTTVFPVNANSFRKGIYRYVLTENESRRSFRYDTETGVFLFTAKNVDRSGLSCPLIVRMTVGDYNGAAQANETTANIRKPVPMKFMRGVQNSLRIDKCKVTRGSDEYTDKLSIKGALASIDADVNLADVNVGIVLDSQTFTLPAGSFIAKKPAKFACKNAAVSETGLATGSYDVNNCSFKLAIKETSVTAQSGYSYLNIKFADFNESSIVYLP